MTMRKRRRLANQRTASDWGAYWRYNRRPAMTGSWRIRDESKLMAELMSDLFGLGIAVSQDGERTAPGAYFRLRQYQDAILDEVIERFPGAERKTYGHTYTDQVITVEEYQRWYANEKNPGGLTIFIGEKS